uniref:Fanconi anemia group D2 protein isoform X3 n=1 Tax=Geotrypetes seraphini TaxID=260995 RepID=A0A6P8Q3E1_GEOSA|nr:Fanconi anemia group D2 protein isoform X3 [Geotrypetes seraphini]
MGAKKKRSRGHEEEEISLTAKAKKSRISSKKSKTCAEESLVENDTVFVQLLKASGVTLKAGEKQNELAVDQVVFQKKLYQAFRKHPRFPNVIQEFVSGLESHIEDRDKFRNCLLPCGHLCEEEFSNLVNPHQESLIKVLLGIEILQPAVISVLFEKLPEFLYDSVGSDGINLPRLIINQFKWLDRIVDSKDLTSKIMQLLSIAPAEIQHDIITSLPEILEDSVHNDIARELNLLLQQNTRLTVPILDTLSSLNLNEGLVLEMCQSVMATLSAVELEDLPTIIKFILHVATPVDVVEVISNIRKKLDLESCALSQQVQASQNKLKSSSSLNRSSTVQDCITLLLDVIKSAVRFQKTVSEAWIKAIENIESAAEHKVIDFIVLLILYTTNVNNSKKQVERVLRNKIRMGYVKDQLLQNAFRTYSLVLREYFPSIISLAQTLLRSADQSAMSFGSLMHKHMFTAFDSYCQQEVVAALVMHVCSGYSAEVDVSLDVLMDLVSLHPTTVALYSVFVKGILDYMDNLNPQQIRKVFCILSRLAFNKGHESSHIQDDMYIVIRKQLFSSVLKYKRIGIIGAVMIVGSMAMKSSKPEREASQKMHLSSEVYRQVTALLELVHSCSEQAPEAAAFYYDELASLVHKGNLDKQVMDWIARTVLDDFQEDYVVDLTPTVEGDHLMPVKALYNLDEEKSLEGIVINLLPLLSRDNLNKGAAKNMGQRVVSPVCLAPFFRLLRLCMEKQHNGNLEQIDALLGCPLYLTDLEVTEKLESLSKQEKEFLCSLLFFAINWFREIVNAFCKQQDPEMKGKVLTRLQQITCLQTVLAKCLAATPGYVPPLSNFDSEALEGVPAVNTAIPTKKSKTGGKKRASDSSKNSSADSSQMEEHQEGEQTETSKTQTQKDNSRNEESGKSIISLHSYRAHLRELTLEVFTVLHCGLLTRSVLDTEMHTKSTEVVHLGPVELVFLLDDLSQKLEHMLVSTAKKVIFLKAKGDRTLGFSQLHQKSSQEVAYSTIQLLNPLCNHMENMHNYFQVLLAENKGAMDAHGIDFKEYHFMSSCYQLLLQIFHILFAWNGFGQHENRKLLKSALGVLADRLKVDDSELTIDELVSQSFHYLLNFCSSAPRCTSALGLTQLLLVIAEKSSVQEYRGKIASLAKGFLCQKWIQPMGEREKGNRYNDTLQSLLCIYLEYTHDVLKAVEEISGIAVPELVNAAKDGNSSTFQTLTRQTFLVFFRVMMDKLEKTVRNFPAGKPSDLSEVQTEQLLLWNLAVRDFHILVNLVKVFDSRPVLSICLKYGRLFMETFLKMGMPLLDCSFKKHREDVQSLLKTLQLSTRQLHHMCGHSKINQDMGLTTHVPLLKKTLELFVYRVKAMLTLNNCQEAFWLGNLKNRDLQGEEILSQVSQRNETDEEQESQRPMEDTEEQDEDGEDNEESDRDSA